MRIVLESDQNINTTINKNELINFYICETEDDKPICCFHIPIKYLDEVKKHTKCTVYHDSSSGMTSAQFTGAISDVKVKGNSFWLSCTASINNTSSNLLSIDPEIADVLYDNETLKPPKIMQNFVVEPENVIENVDQYIIKDSLAVEKLLNNVVSAVDLEISCSWMSFVDGDIDITSKIANRFSDGKINTLTGNKFEMSWPKFGDRIVCRKSARQSKYYIGCSRIYQETPLHMKPENLYTPPISIKDLEKPIKLRRRWYNHKLSVCFGYNQYHKETIKARINNQHSPNSNLAEKIRINLKNIQKFLPNMTTESFFTETTIGQKVYKHIIETTGTYIAMSMRNLKIKFKIPYGSIQSISCKNWIKIDGIPAKITSLKFEDGQHVHVEAMGFSDDLIRQKIRDLMITKLVQYDDPEATSKNEVTSNDVIQDIVVENDGAEQIDKLMSFVSSQQLNKENYKSSINKFLNENSTKIHIITKPLKTENCVEKTINIGECKFL